MKRKILGVILLVLGGLLLLLHVSLLVSAGQTFEGEALKFAFSSAVPVVIVALLDTLVGFLTLKGRRLRWAVIMLIVSVPAVLFDIIYLVIYIFLHITV